MTLSMFTSSTYWLEIMLTTSSKILRCWYGASWPAMTLPRNPPTIANTITGAEMDITISRVRELIAPRISGYRLFNHCSGSTG